MLSIAISLDNNDTIYTIVEYKSKKDFMRFLNQYDYIIVNERTTNNEIIINTKKIVCIR